MKFGRRAAETKRSLVSVVVPVYNVEAYLPECLDSILASSTQTWRSWSSTTARPTAPAPSPTPTPPGSAGSGSSTPPTAASARPATRGPGTSAGDFLAFADSDDVVPPTAYAVMVASLNQTGSDFATGSIRLARGRPACSSRPWMRRLHNPPWPKARAAQHPEILGDVFAWNKLYRRSWWDRLGPVLARGHPLRGPADDHPGLPRRPLRRAADDVYHWRIRDDGSSITQQRASIDDLRDRWATKRMALAAVEASPDAAAVREVFLDRVLAGDLHRYFVHIPACTDEWWRTLHRGIGDMWAGRSLVHSGLPPVHRLTGWLVEQNRRMDAAAVMLWFASLDGKPVPQRRRAGRALDHRRAGAQPGHRRPGRPRASAARALRVSTRPAERGLDTASPSGSAAQPPDTQVVEPGERQRAPSRPRPPRAGPRPRGTTWRRPPPTRGRW